MLRPALVLLLLCLLLPVASAQAAGAGRASLSGVVQSTKKAAVKPRKKKAAPARCTPARKVVRRKAASPRRRTVARKRSKAGAAAKRRAVRRRTTKKTAKRPASCVKTPSRAPAAATAPASRVAAVPPTVAPAAVTAVSPAPAPEGPPAPLGPVEPEFFGAVADAAFATRGRARGTVLDAVARSGVRTLRQTFNWATIEKTPGTWNWTALDAYVADTSRKGIEVLPILFGAPDFAARANPDGTRSGGFYPPADDQRFADFAGRAVKRYGRDGEFWRAHPSLPYRPIGAWEVWNEPNGEEFWRTGVNGTEYARLLIAASAAIKAADPAATVVSAGLPAMGGPRDAIRPYLDEMYRAGAGPAMDAVGLHPYAPSATKMRGIIAEGREVMNRYGDQGKKMWITEFGYATGGPASDYLMSEEAHAVAVAETAEMAVAERERLGIGKLVYYSLSDLPVWPGGIEFWGLHCGLFRIDGQPKPVAAALGRTVARLTATEALPAPAAIPDLRDIVAGRVDNGGAVPF